MTWKERRQELEKKFNRRHFSSIRDLVNCVKEPRHLLQIGAMDAKSFDPLAGHIDFRKWKVTFVEPQPQYAAQLRQRFKGNRRISVLEMAVSDQPGKGVLHYVDPEAVKAGLVPDWAAGIASLYTDKNAIGGVGCTPKEFEAIKEHILTFEISTCTLADIYKKFDQNFPNVVLIDAEGADYVIFNQLLSIGRWPELLIIEIVNLAPEETHAMIGILNDAGYYLAVDELNLVCFRGDGPA